MVTGGILLTFIPRFPAVVATYSGLWLLKLSNFVSVSDSIMYTWGVASAIVVMLALILPRDIAASRRGVTHIAITSLAGAVIGAGAANVTSIIAGAIVGALLGVFAYSRTTCGRELARSGNRFVNYALAKAMPAVINFSMTGIFIAFMAQLI